MERVGITTVIRTTGSEDSVFINGVVSQEIKRINAKHREELSGYRSAARQRNEKNRKTLDAMLAVKQKTAYDRFLEVAIIPVAIGMTIGENLMKFAKAIGREFCCMAMCIKRGLSRALTAAIRALVNFGLKHNMIVYDED